MNQAKGRNISFTAKPALSSKARVNTAIGASHTGYGLADVLLDGRRPRPEAEAEAVVDHREAAGCKGEAPVVGAGNILPAGGLAVRHVHFIGELFAERVEFTLPERTKQVAGEDDPLALAPCQAFFDQMFGSGFHRLAHFQPEAHAEIDRIASDKLAIEPCGTVGCCLHLNGKIGADGQRYAVLASRIL